MHAYEKIKVNITLELSRIMFIELEKEYSQDVNIKLIDSRVIPNTDHLKDDEEFQKLVKQARQAKKVKYEYINKHNK